MTNTDKKSASPDTPIKAVGLISGGLDSTLAAKVVKDLGIDVYGVYFAMPWGCCDKTNAVKCAQSIGIKMIVLQLDERYLEMVRKPKYGRGTALNPCVDCRIHMFSRAAQYMKHIGAEFIFTGEILGQRPMSQRKDSMRWIEDAIGLSGRLLRPLCAQNLPPTEMEQSGMIDRSKLLSIVGRSRKEQYRLAKEYELNDFSAPGGGCLLTDRNFARRMTDTLKHGYRNFRETVALKWGRHFRLSEQYKAILGRDAHENDALMSYAHAQDTIIQLRDERGPTLILKGDNPPMDILQECAGLIQRYTKRKDDTDLIFTYFKADNRNSVQTLSAVQVSDERLEQIRV